VADRPTTPTGSASSDRRGGGAVADRAPLTLAELDRLEVEVLAGVGPKRAAALAEMGVRSVCDLLMLYPRRYVDRSREARVSDLESGDEAMVLASVEAVRTRRSRGGRTLVEVRVADDTGRLPITFFNQAWRARQLREGVTAVFFGKVDSYRGRKQMTNPIVDLVGDRTGRIVPIYPQSERAGLMTWDLAAMVAEALRRSEARGIEDPVPHDQLARHGLGRRDDALRDIHTPETAAAQRAARDRLVFDELLRVQLLLLQRKHQLETGVTGIEHRVDGPALARFWADLPFVPTAAQRRALDEIRADLARSVPMHRLLQGDVGAGKTLVAVGALVTAVDGGYQGAFMAPTEVLAEQHHASVLSFLAKLDVDDEAVLGGRRPLRVELLTARLGTARRREVLTALASGAVDIAVGTHALIQEGVEFSSLGVVVVDEQHRFGVEQRSMLRDRGRGDGRAPDVLVMTATPIPRTAAMTVYGDLDVSVLDELPPGRSPIATTWTRGDLGRDAVWQHVRDEVAAGRQAYVVCPVIEGSDALEVESAVATYDDLGSGALAGLRVGLMHGRLKPDEKDLTMRLFRSGRLDVLVATTVIEVGVDVPNATIMVVLSADRFGMAQLHQLRGRVGRGAASSTCWLVTDDDVTPEAEQRLQALERSTDGFELAEIDLDLRGEGTLFAGQQSGRNDLRLASLRRDRDWVVRARQAATELLAEDPSLAGEAALAVELEWFQAKLAEGGDDQSDWLLRG